MSVTGITETTQYLTFNLEDETYALHVDKVREILEFNQTTKIPQAPDFIRGVINLRGTVVPVVDLRQKFGMSKTEKTVDTCIIVVEVTQDDALMIIGALVDSVQEVFELDPEAVESPPKIGSQLDTDFIKGMGKHNDQLIIILDIDKVLASEDLNRIPTLNC